MRALAARLALFLAVAAVIAGLLGMHVLNGQHAGHTAGAAAMDLLPAEAAAVHAMHSLDARGCGCSGPCPEVSETHPSCVPMPSNLSLDAPGGSPLVLPPAPPVMRLSAPVVADPRSPSLQELCISRC